MTALAKKVTSTTLDKLRQGARTQFVERGYHNTRPQDIARQAGVANGTFYIHYADKKEAFLDFAEQAQSELLEQYIERLNNVSDQRQRWMVICNTVVEFAIENPGLLQAAFLDPVFIAPDDETAWRLYDRLGHFVELALTDGAPRDFDTELISHALCGMLRNAMVYASRKKISREKMIEDLSLFIDRGLGNGQSPIN